MNWKMANVYAGLLFWGWWADYIGMAVVLVILIALLIAQPSRREITDTQFNRIVDLTSLVIFSIGIYLVVANGTQGLFTLFAWLPKMMFPLYAVQLYSEQGGIKLSSLMWSLRGRQQVLSVEQDQRTDLSWIPPCSL